MPKIHNPTQPLVIAIPKGRVLKQLSTHLRSHGWDTRFLMEESRRLVREDASTAVRFLLLKPDDVPTYVEYGAADLGVVGRDVLLEREYDVYSPLDLGIGKCRMVVAGLPGSNRLSSARKVLRVATKFVNIASRHFLARGIGAEVIFVQGSVELAPLTKLSDVIVDLVESGQTLRENGLVELETIHQISTVVIANRVSLKLKQARIAPILERL